MTTYYLSFDVGIKNLAYCFACYKKNLTIIDWNIINFSQEEFKCNQINKKMCCKKALYYNCDKTNLYCNKHYKTKTEKVIKIPNATLLINVSQLLKELDNLFDNILNMPYFDDKFNIKNPKNINIIIENQPVFLIPTMKTYSIIIYGYFIYKKKQYPNFINDVKFINAIVKTSDKFITTINNKLNMNNLLFNQYKKLCIEKINIKKTKKTKNNTDKNKKNTDNKIKPYELRKNFSIDFVNNIIEKININCYNVVSITNFELEKKKDDLSDALLYVLHSIYI